jgi:hypothetical protein
VKILAAVFAFMALYGLYEGSLGAALLAAFMAVFTLWCNRILDKQEAAYRNDPGNTPSDPDTKTELDKHECESWRDQF